jgi:hypothetical protein
MDGMDYTSVANAAQKGVYLLSPITGQTPRISGTGSSIKFQTDCEWKSPMGLWNEATTVGFGAGWYCGSSGLQNDHVWWFNSSNTGNQITISTKASGVLYVTRAGTQLGSDVAFALDTWHYIECKVVIASGTSGSVVVKLDGQTVLNLTGQNTQAQGTGTGVSQLRFLSSANNNFLDDLVMWDTTGSVNNDFMGDVKVYQLLPRANGDVNSWTASTGSNYQCVDEATPNDDTDYVETSTVSNADRYFFTTLSESGNMKGVMVNGYARKTDAYVRSLRLQAMSNSNLSESGDKYVSDTYQTFFGMFERNPDGNVAWTDATINAATFGVKVQA